MPLFTRLRAAGAEEELVNTIRALGPRAWQQPHIELAFLYLARKRDWPAIVRLFDANPGYGKVLCGGLELQPTLSVIMGLRAVGRGEEAARLLRCQEQWLAKANRGPVGHPGPTFAFVNGIMAMIRAIEGREADAFHLMTKAVDEGYRTAHGEGLSALPFFDQYRANPKYAALDRRLKELIARERAEVLRQ